MTRAFVVALAALALCACGDTLAPRLNPSSAAASFDVALQQDVVARSVVLPSAYADVMGEANNIFPHSPANMRYQQVFLGAELGGLRSVGGLCLRRDEIVLRSLPAHTKQLTVRLGPTTLDHTTLGRRFDENYSAAPTTVFSGAVDVPAGSSAGTPSDFYLCIDFTTRYVHPADRNLIVEVVNTSTAPIPSLADACGGPLPPGVPPRPGCTTARVFAFGATATEALFRDRTGLVMKFISADPTTKDECKDGGWEGFGFATQGHCIRFIETGQDTR